MDAYKIKLQKEEPLTIKMIGTSVGGTSDYDKLVNKPIHMDTTANWNVQTDLIAKEGHIYIYTDYRTVDGVAIPAFKIGDGLAYLIDVPFVYGNQDSFEDHINDTTVHITEEERLFWNNKVTCFLSNGDEETVVFTKDKET